MNKEEMLRLRLEGETYQSIADKAGVSRQRIQQVISPPKAIRDYIIAKYDGMCAKCGLIVGKPGHVHHNIGNGENYNDIDNLELLCISCHRVAHTLYKSCPQCGGNIPKSRLNIFCNKNCYHEYSCPLMECEICGFQFRRNIKHIIWQNEHNTRRTGEHIFCSRKCLGKWAGTNHGFATRPNHGRSKRKWDYELVYKTKDDTGFGATKLSRILHIPIPTIEFILKNRLGKY